MSEAVEVEVGTFAACARSDDGRVWCWWLRRHSARRILAVERATDIAVGDEVWVLGESGVVTAIELEPRVPISGIRRTQIVDLGDAIDIEGSESVGCARRRDGGVACWESQIGTDWDALPPGDWQPHTAVAVPQLRDSVEIRVGGMHACARDRYGTIACWGRNAHFELGDANGRRVVWPPNRVDGLPPVTEVHVGAAHACAVESAGSMWCWGGFGWISTDAVTRAGPAAVEHVNVYRREHLLDIQELATVEGLLIGDHVDCAQFSRTLLRCWGNNALAISHPRGEVAIPSGTRSIDLGPRWGCMAGGYGVQCFGSPSYASGGRIQYSVTPAPASVQPPTPVRFPQRASATEIVVGRAHACALLEDRSAWCWGDNEFAQVDANLPGVRPLAELEVPVEVSWAPELLMLSAGTNHTCGLDADGAAWCWGGADTTAIDGRPRVVADLPPVRELAAGDRHTCGVALDDVVWCWEVGGDPSQVPKLRDVVELDAHGKVDCALDRAGAVHCWGDNSARVADPSSPLSSAIPLEVAASRKRRIAE